MRFPSHVLGALIALLGATPSVAAQDAPFEATATSGDARDEQARRLYEAGRSAFEREQYEIALGHFRVAHELTGRSALLYNIALCADRLDHAAEALEAYEGYLEGVADAPERVLAESRVRELRARLTADTPTIVEEPVVTPPSVARPQPDATVPVTLLTSGVVAMVGGGVLLGLGIASQFEVENPAVGATWPDVRGAYDRAPILGGSGVTLLGVGAALIVAGAVLYPSGPETELALTPNGLLLRGHF